jgi:hypothetical protein
MHEIRLTVNPDGTTQTDFSGFVGKTCLAEAEKLREALKALGITVSETNFIAKPELDHNVIHMPQTTTHEENAS